MKTREQDHGLDAALDNTLIQLCEGALLDGRPVRLEMPVRNVNRTVGTMLGSLVTRRFGAAGLPDDTIDVTFTRFGRAVLRRVPAPGVTLRLHGDANDYVGKGLSGGVLVVRPDARAAFTAEDNVIAGNVIGYGATSGRDLPARHRRRAVRGAQLRRGHGVAEGAGDHALEYMTGGIAVILGRTGRNVGAGMSGGYAYVLDLDPALVNRELVDVGPVPPEQPAALPAMVAAHAA